MSASSACELSVEPTAELSKLHDDIRSVIGDPNGIEIAEDMMRIYEGIHGPIFGKKSGAHHKWLWLGVDADTPHTDAVIARTLYVIDKHTTECGYGPRTPPNHADFKPTILERLFAAEQIEDARYGSWAFWFPEARKALRTHRGADRIRVVKPDGQYRPMKNEVVMVLRKKKAKKPEQRWQLWVDEKCAVPKCSHVPPTLFLDVQGAR